MDANAAADCKEAQWRIGFGPLFVVIYLVLGFFSPRLGPPPGYPSAIWSTGVAMTCVLVYGWRVLPWVFIAAALTCFCIVLQTHGYVSGRWQIATICIALASTVQSAVGGPWLRRRLGLPTKLDRFGDLLALGGIAAASCAIAPGISTGSQLTLGLLTRDEALQNALTQWLSNTTSVVALLPIVLVLIGVPRSAWRARTRTLALPLACAVLLLFGALVEITRWERDAMRSSFSAYAQEVQSSVEKQLAIYAQLLQQLCIAMTGAHPISENQFSRLARSDMQVHSEVRVVEWAPLIPDRDRAAYEAAQQRRQPGFRITQMDSRRTPVPAARREEYLPLTYVQPIERNRAAFGYDAASEPVRLEAILRARRAGPGYSVASAPLTLVQDDGPPSSLLLVQALEASGNGPGVVQVGVRFQDLMQSLQLIKHGFVATRLIDRDAGDAILFDDMTNTPLADKIEHRFEFGGRHYALQMIPTLKFVDASRKWDSFGLLIGGLLVILLLQMLLIQMSTHTSRAEQLVRQRTQALEESMRDAQAAARAKSDFLAAMSHELRTPMNGVIGMLSILLDAPLQPHERDLAETACNSAEALLNILNDILDFSKIEAGKMQLETVDFDLLRLLDDVIDVLAFAAVDKDLELSGCAAPEVPAALRGDPGRLRQILVNFAGNGVKFTERGEVTITVRAIAVSSTATRLRFEVRDTGIGIEREEIPALFEPFVQADNSATRRFGGTGLGLSICRRLVQSMGGIIGVDSTPGQGSLFWFEVPLERQAKDAAETSFTAAAFKDRSLVVMTPTRGVCKALIAQLQRLGCHATCRDLNDKVPLYVDGRRVDAVVFEITNVEKSEWRRLRELKSELPRRVPLIGLLPCVRTDSLGAHHGEPQLDAVLEKPLRYGRLVRALEQAFHARTAARLADGQLRRGTLLAVDDNLVNLKFVETLLRRRGFEVDAVVSGTEALRRLAKKRFDLALIDCMMPGMDGFEVARAIRTGLGDVTNPAIPMVAMSGSISEPARENILEAGFAAFISKPIDSVILLDTIDAVLSSSGQRPVRVESGEV
jgi:signal transduction histidine kinase/CheY-like chemotaxis protein